MLDAHSVISPHPVFGRVHWAFSGGVFKGAAFPGAVQALLDREIFPISISTASVSSLEMAPLAGARTRGEFSNAVAYITRRWQEIERIGPEAIFPNLFPRELSWRELRAWWKKLYVWNAHGVASNEPLYNLLSDFDPGWATRSDGVHMYVGVSRHEGTGIAHELISFRDIRFDVECDGNPELLRDFIVASASPEPIFAPVEIGGVRYADGDIVDLDPILLEDKADTIFLFLCCPENEHRTKQKLSLINSMSPRAKEFVGFFLRHFPFIPHFISHYISPIIETEELLSVQKAEYLARAIRAERALENVRRNGGASPGRREEFPRIVKTHLPIPQSLVENRYGFKPGAHGVLTEVRTLAYGATARTLDNLFSDIRNPS